MKSELVCWIDVKVENIYAELKRLFEEQSDKKIKSGAFKHPIICKILSMDNPSIEQAKRRKFNDPDDLEYCFRKYQDVIAEINLYTILIPSIETFCMFMSWTAATMKIVANNASQDIQAVLDLVEDYIVDSQLTAGQSGFVRASITKFRTQVSGEHGQGLMTAKEEQSKKHVEGQTKKRDELLADLENLGFMIELPNKK